MRRQARALAWATTTLFASLAITSSLAVSPGFAADLIWEVENPFRFFKPTRSFALHEAAFNAARGDPAGALPADIIWRTERQLNNPDCKDASTPDRCAATAGKRYQQSRLGWAAQTVGETCYDSNGRPRRYATVCERKYSWGSAKEDYVLPEAHTVAIRIAPEQLAGVTGDCVWSWQARKAGGKNESKKIACKDKLTIARVPYALERAGSGVSVTVKLPDGRELAEQEVVVEDLFIVALGDSFASGESNPDKPVQFSASRQMVYDPTLMREEVASKAPAKGAMPNYGLASGDDQFDPKVLPRRFMDDETAERFYKLSSPEFAAAFDKAAARWLSRDCHRSQYGYPFRVAIELALENRHRSVTLASLTCSGAEVTAGLFLDMDPREGAAEIPGGKVRAQLDQLSDLLCRGARSQSASYTLPTFDHGSPQISAQQITKTWCPPQSRKRAIDVVLMSIGGNDVGFGALAAYSLTENVTDLAPIAGLAGGSMRFAPSVSRVYLEVLDERMKAVKDALQEGFGVPPARVVQSSYEPIQYDETGALCGANPTLGMDVHPGLKLSRQRLSETADFLKDFLGRLECIAGGKNRAGCPANLATGAGTGFTLVTDHIPEFNKRGLCARDPKRALADGINMRVPRLPTNGDAFKPYSPAATLPYAHHWRLFRTPNDAFLAANTHREGTPLFDILQPAYAGLYSGAIHPTAEAHAIVADHVVRHVRKIVDKPVVVEKQDVVESKAR
jgi:lysophospholipase L1-like esterase